MNKIPLLLLPGMMCDQRMFEPQIAALAEVADIHVGDITNANSMAEIAQQVLATVPPQFALAGLSMGGIVAMEIVRQAPDRVLKLALLDTNPWAELEEVKLGRRPQMNAVMAHNDGLTQVVSEQMIRRYFYSQKAYDQFAPVCLAMAQDLGAQVFVRQSQALRDRIDQQQTLAAFTKPCLIIMGIEDQLCPLDRHERMHELMRQSTFIGIPRAGHIPTIEQPEATNAALMQWLSQAIDTLEE